jgi:hypothetical protein
VIKFLLSLTFALYRSFHTKRIEELRAKYNFHELKRKYERLHSLGSLMLVFLVLPGSLAGGYFLGRLAYATANQWYWRTVETKFLIAPSWIAMYFALGFLSLIAIPLTLIGIGKVVMGAEKYREYEAYDSLKAGFDSSRIMGATMIAIATPMLLLLAMSVDNFIRCDESNIVVNPFWTFGSQRYSMDDIATIEASRQDRSVRGGVISVPYYYLQFKDRRIWRTQGPFAVEVNPAVLGTHRQMIEFISDRSQVPIKEVEHSFWK